MRKVQLKIYILIILSISLNNCLAVDCEAILTKIFSKIYSTNTGKDVHFFNPLINKNSNIIDQQFKLMATKTHNAIQANKNISIKDITVHHHSLNNNLIEINIATTKGTESYNQYLSVFGNYVGRTSWGEASFKNIMVEFDNEGEKIIRKLKFIDLIIEQMPAKEITLVRNMDDFEAKLWSTSNIKGLKKKSEKWYFDTPIVHFELNKRSWIGSHRKRKLEWKIPKSLLKELSKNDLITAGITSNLINKNKEFIPDIEIVVRQEAWEKISPYLKGENKDKIPLYLQKWAYLIDWITRRNN